MDCCEFHFYGFFIMNISVCFLEKVKIDMLYSFLYFNLCKTFFLQSTQFLYGYVWSWHGDSCANADLCPSSFTALYELLHNLSYFTDELDHFSVRFRPLWHTCNHSPRDYAQVPNNWLIFVGYPLSNSLVALNSVCVIVSKIRPFLRANEVLLGRFFFLTLDGFLIICSCQNSQFQLLCTSL
jgi:hypothetical protein